MGPPSLDLSLEEVIKASKGGSGKGRGRRDAEKAKEEEAVSLDMSLEELIEKDYLPAKGKGKAKEENGWEKKSDKSKGQSWNEDSYQKSAGSWKSSWKEKEKDSWKSSWKEEKPEWKKPAKSEWKADAWKTEWKDSWTGGAGAQKDWSGSKWGEDEWKPRSSGQDWKSGKANWSEGRSWEKTETSDKYNSWQYEGSNSWEARDPPRQAWRPQTEREREERWNGRSDRRRSAWERDDRNDAGYGRNDGYGRGDVYVRPAVVYGRDGYQAPDARDRRGQSSRPRSRSRGRYAEPRGCVILVKNIPLGLDSRDIRDAFQSATGVVTSCKLSHDGTARISFDRPEDAKKAVATFDQGELNGNIISVHVLS